MRTSLEPLLPLLPTVFKMRVQDLNSSDKANRNARIFNSSNWWPSAHLPLHDRAWEIVAANFSKADNARECYAQLHGSARTSEDFETVVHAALRGLL